MSYPPFSRASRPTRSARSPRILLPAFLAALCVTVSRPAGAQASAASTPGTGAAAPAPAGDVAKARELFVQASDQRDQGDVRGALEKFKAAHALAANPVTAFELARTYQLLGKLVEARDAFASIARMPAQPDESPRAILARQDAARAVEDLRRRIPMLSVKLAVAPSAVSIAVDGTPLPPALLVALRPVDPGSHEIVAVGPGGERAVQRVDVKEGETREVDLATALAPTGSRELKTAPPPPVDPSPLGPATSPAPAAADVHNRFGPLTYAGFAVGVAGFATGTILALVALSKASSVQGTCTDMACALSALDDLNSAKDLGYASAAAFAIAGAGVAVGIVDLLVYTPGPRSPSSTGFAVRPWVGAGVGGVRASF
jgi:hypothetical protein